MFKLRPKGHEGIHHVGIWGRAFPAPGTASAKPLVWEDGMREGERASRVHGVGWVRERQARDGAEVWQEPALQGLVGFRQGLGVILSKTECYRGGGFEKRRNMITMMPVVSHRGQVGEARWDHGAICMFQPLLR